MTVTLDYTDFIKLQDMIEAYDGLDQALETSLNQTERAKIRNARATAIEKSNAARAIFAGGRARALSDRTPPPANPTSAKAAAK